jgi:hypothetical protein
VIFPHEAVRDLLGIARALYAAERDEMTRDELKTIGLALAKAAFDARRLPPASLGGRAAFRRAEEATARLCAVVSGDVERLVRAAAGRVRRGT